VRAFHVMYNTPLPELLNRKAVIAAFKTDILVGGAERTARRHARGSALDQPMQRPSPYAAAAAAIGG
jgi:hypothetical protein